MKKIYLMLLFVVTFFSSMINVYADEISYKMEFLGSLVPTVEGSAKGSRTRSIEVLKKGENVYAYMANDLGMFVYDVTDMSTPVKIQYVPELLGQGILAISNGRLYYSYADQQLYCFDINADGTVDVKKDDNGITSPAYSANIDMLISVDDYVFAYRNYTEILVFDASAANPVAVVKAIGERGKYKRQMTVKKVSNSLYRISYIQQNGSEFALICTDYNSADNTMVESVNEIIPEWTVNSFGKMAFVTDFKIAVSNKESSSMETIYTVDFSDYYDGDEEKNVVCKAFSQLHNQQIAYAGNLQRLNENELALWNKASFVKSFEEEKPKNLETSSILSSLNDAKDFDLLGDVDYLACDGSVMAVKITRQQKAKQTVEKPIVINSSWKAGAGDAIGIYGYGFDEARVIIIPESTQEEYYLDILSCDDTYIQGVLPIDIPYDNYTCYIECEGKRSDSFTINTPSVDWISEPEFCIGQVVRAFGRNFVNTKTRVWLKKLSDGSELEAEVVTVTDYTVDFKIPEGVVSGEKYTVRVSNGGGYICELEEAEASVCKSNAKFYEVKEKFGVSVGWADELVTDRTFNVKNFGAKGNGTADDSEAVENAIKAAKNAGGGIIYFPEGTYNLKSMEVQTIPDLSVICGDGKDKTSLLIENRIYFSANYGGICKLSLISENTRPSGDTQRRTSGYVGGLLYGSGSNVHFFVDSIGMSAADGSSFVSYDSKHLVIEDSSFDISHYGPYQQNNEINEIRKTRYINNYVRNSQRPLLWLGGHSWIDGCTFVGENPDQEYEKTDGEVISAEHRIADLYGDKIFYGNNHVLGLIGDAREEYDDSCGEGICNQANKRIAVGEVAGSTPNTLITRLDFDKIKTETNANGTARGDYLIGSKVAIISGNGVGQIRKIIAAKGNTITVDKPWDLEPCEDDVYVINGEIAEKYIIVNNNIEAITRKGGIMLYTSSFDNIIDNNTLTNGGGIWFGKTQNSNDARAEISYFNYVANNELSGGVPDKTGGQRDNALYIGVGDDGGAITTLDLDYPSISQYANMYKSNIIEGTGTDVTAESSYNGKFVNYNGIVLSTVQEGFDSPISKGVIVSDNVVTNSVNGIYTANTTENTLIYNNTFRDNKNNYNNNSGNNSVVSFGLDCCAEDMGNVMLAIAHYSSDGNLIKTDVQMVLKDTDLRVIYQKYIMQEFRDGEYIKFFAFDESQRPLHGSIRF